MEQEIKLKKRKKPKFHVYPAKRKKKKPHVQWFDFHRVVEKWNIVPSVFYMFAIPEKGGWWACKLDRPFFGNIECQGDYYKPVYKVDYYDGQSGDSVYGYVGVIYYCNMSIEKGRFVFVKNPMNMGLELSHVLCFKTKLNLEKYKKFEIWKKK